jgi:HAD superfamily hydrolase (TIGR01509 family)
MQTQAIIFDIDGTIADTEETHRVSFNSAFSERKLDWNWDVPLYNQLLKVTGGKERIKYFIETYLPNYKKPEKYEEFVSKLHMEKTSYYTNMLKKGLIPFRPNIKKLIIDAKKSNIRLAIATTTSPENVTALMEQEFGKGYEKMFDAIGCGDIVSKKKPAPDIYEWVLNQMKLKPDNCISLEDSENGLKSSLGAGIKTFITTNLYTQQQDFTGAVAVYKDLSNLEEFYLLAKLNIQP